MSGRKYAGCLDFRVILSVCAALLIVGVWASTTPANDVPPTPIFHFYGDATGDMIIDASDLSQMRAYTLGLPYTYDTLQPQTYSQAWNTGDLTSDRIIDAADISAAKMYTLGFLVTVEDKPWVLQNVNLPLSGNAINTWIPFNVNLYSTNAGMVGRPGISVIAEIAPVGDGSTVTGQISGRECNPVPGSRDQQTISGAQCALSVTQTDWGPHPDQGLTESGTYGFQLKGEGNGQVKLRIRIEALPALDIPAVSLALVVGFTGNAVPNIVSSAPTPATEGRLYTYVAVGRDVDVPPELLTCSKNGADTCNGTLSGLSNCTYKFTPSEAQGGSTCTIGLRVTDNGAPPMYSDQNTAITIQEDNKAPYFTSSAPASASQGVLYTYNAVITDADVPSQIITCSKNAADTCEGTLNGCSYTFTPTWYNYYCVIGIRATDNGVPPRFTDQNSAVHVLTSTNPVPTIGGFCPDASENDSIACTIWGSDGEFFPPGPVYCWNGGSTCKGVVVADDCSLLTVASQGEDTGPGWCTVDIGGMNSHIPEDYTNWMDTIRISEVNQSPQWQNAPTAIQVNPHQIYDQRNGHVIDNDLPNTAPWDPGHLFGCYLTAHTCSFPIVASVQGNGNGSLYCRLSFTAGSAFENCSATIEVSDSWAPPAAISSVVNISVNSGPTVSIDCLNPGPNPVNELSPVQCSVNGTGGTPAVNGASDTCGGVISGSGPWVYTATPTEAQGPGNCTAAVINGAAIANDIVYINEVNQSPTLTVNCPSHLSETSAGSCALIPSDGDLPAQTLTCTKSATSTCKSLTVTGCASVAVGAQGESIGPGSCTVVINIADSRGGTGQGISTIIIDEANQAPIWSPSPSNISIYHDQAYSANNGHAFDLDYPSTNPSDPGHISLTKTGQTCSFDVTVSGSGTGNNALYNAVSFTAGSAPETCGVDVTVTDGYGATLAGHFDISVNPDPRIFYVDADATGAGTGLNWTDALNGVQSGVDAAWYGCEVWVAEGTYFRPIGGNEPVLTMKYNVSVYGGFVGTESMRAERGNPRIHLTTLDGENASYHVVVLKSNTVLDGFTVTRGNAVGTSPNNYGGGMYVVSLTNAAINNVDFLNNHATSGGGVYNYSTALAITNSSFLGCSATYGGGILINISTGSTLTNCIFYNNTATYGGGIEASSSTIYLTNSTITGNTASGLGGGLYSSNGTSTIKNSIFWGNSSQIYNSAGNILVSYSDVQGGYPGTGNINSNPLFVGASDFHPQLGSPCINSATATGAPTIDFDGNPRPSPLAGSFDMGAYEYQWP